MSVRGCEIIDYHSGVTGGTPVRIVGCNAEPGIHHGWGVPAPDMVRVPLNEGDELVYIQKMINFALV